MKQRVSFIFLFNKTSFLHKSTKAIEGFDGKRALGILLKSELCQKCSKFRLQFCLGALNNVLYAFSCWSLLRFRNIPYAKKNYLLSRQHVTTKTLISLEI